MDKQNITRNHKKCVICGRRRIYGSSVFLARIPLDPVRSRMWVKVIGQQDLVHLPIEKLHELKYVCDKHFQSGDFNVSRTRLLKHAVPSMHLNANPLQDELLIDFPVHIGQYPITNTDIQGSSAVAHQSKIDMLPASGNENLCSKEPSEVTIPVTNVLQDITNHDSVIFCQTTQAVKRNHDQIDAEVAGPSCNNFYVQNYLRKGRSVDLKGLSTREEKLLHKLKETKLSLKKLAESTLDFDNLDNCTLKSLVSDAVKNHKKKPTGKRWTLKTKLWALAIFKRSPKAYRYLEWAMPVPSVKTLQRLLSNIPLEPGINEKLILKFKNSIKKLSQQDKFCALLFDEISLKKRLIYNDGTDKIEGYEDLGDDRTENIADHALVFMVQGLRKKFKQPIAYFFVKGTISSVKLLAIIKKIIKCLDDVGFKILTTVCDQGPTNVGALNLLKKFGGQTPDDNFFIFDEKKVYIIYDIPHLFKSLRNNFYNAGDIHYNGMIGKWSHLIEAEERNRNFLNFKKISKNVVHPTFRLKMRVKYAAHALSNTMSAVLKMLSWKHETAAELLLNFYSRNIGQRLRN